MRLNKTQKYAIQWLVHTNTEITDIIKDLKLPENVVKAFIEKNYKTAETNTIQTSSSQVTSKQLMIRNTSAKNTNSVAIMTKEASEIGDSFKKSINDNYGSKRNVSTIHKIS